MGKYKLITCVVQRGKADPVVEAALENGANGATLFYGRGTGVRQKLGVLGSFMTPEKEVILIVTKEAETVAVFKAMVKAGMLDKPGNGFIYVQDVQHAVGFMEKEE